MLFQYLLYRFFVRSLHLGPRHACRGSGLCNGRRIQCDEGKNCLHVFARPEVAGQEVRAAALGAFPRRCIRKDHVIGVTTGALYLPTGGSA
jgi:hypothetical protein